MSRSGISRWKGSRVVWRGHSCPRVSLSVVVSDCNPNRVGQILRVFPLVPVFGTEYSTVACTALSFANHRSKNTHKFRRCAVVQHRPESHQIDPGLLVPLV